MRSPDLDTSLGGRELVYRVAVLVQPDSSVLLGGLTGGLYYFSRETDEERRVSCSTSSKRLKAGAPKVDPSFLLSRLEVWCG